MIREADSHTIIQEPIAEIDLMERAALACFNWMKEHVSGDQKIKVFCGAGNNGGDGLAVARMMRDAGFGVEVFTMVSPDRMSECCRKNFERMQDAGYGIEDSSNLPVISPSDVVIDAIFGSGLTRPADGLSAALIHHINASGAMVVAIDLPSGLICDSTTRATPAHLVIHADYTLTFSPPKLALFFPENDIFVGNWQLLDIGLSEEYINSAKVKNFMTREAEVMPMLKKRGKFSHKGTYGHALIIGGSAGKMGAAVLAARACLRSGPGLVTVRIPSSGISILQTAVPEAMVAIDPNPDYYSEAPELSTYQAIAIGPGIGTSAHTASALKILIQHTRIPIVFDADALNILAENKTWLGFIPKNSIFTPHPGEFERLIGKSSNDFDRNRLQRDFSFRYQCYVVLKGAHTAITTPDGSCHFNTTGNPGMAAGGSGDVLTGIITGLMAQGYSSMESCLLGVYVHGLAGDMALEANGYEALTAGDIISNLGKSFISLYGKF